MKRSLRLLTTMLVLVALPVLTFGAPKKDAKEKKARPFVKVTSVDAAGNKVTIADTAGVEKEYTLGAFAVIVIKGKPGKLADIERGMKASVTASGNSISRLEVEDPPEEKPDRKNR